MRYSTPITILVAEDDADDRLMILEAFEESRVANRVDSDGWKPSPIRAWSCSISTCPKKTAVRRCAT